MACECVCVSISVWMCDKDFVNILMCVKMICACMFMWLDTNKCVFETVTVGTEGQFHVGLGCFFSFFIFFFKSHIFCLLSNFQTSLKSQQKKGLRENSITISSLHLCNSVNCMHGCVAFRATWWTLSITWEAVSGGTWHPKSLTSLPTAQGERSTRSVTQISS